MRLIADALDDAEPVTSVRATGGAFRSPLWREIMAAALGRPFVVVGQAEGTAFGAAALGLVGVGYAATPSEALTMLSDPAAPEPPVVPTDRAVVAAYERLRASVPALVAQLDSVAALFPGAGAVSDAT
jgi:gluconokinase